MLQVPDRAAETLKNPNLAWVRGGVPWSWPNVLLSVNATLYHSTPGTSRGSLSFWPFLFFSVPRVTSLKSPLKEPDMHIQTRSTVAASGVSKPRPGNGSAKTMVA